MFFFPASSNHILTAPLISGPSSAKKKQNNRRKSWCVAECFGRIRRKNREGKRASACVTQHKRKTGGSFPSTFFFSVFRIIYFPWQRRRRASKSERVCVLFFCASALLKCASSGQRNFSGVRSLSESLLASNAAAVTGWLFRAFFVTGVLKVFRIRSESEILVQTTETGSQCQCPVCECVSEVLKSVN